MDKNLRHPRYWPSWLAIGLLRLVAALPLPVLLWLGNMLGIITYHLLKRRRHIAEVNIRLCFPELTPAEQQQLVKRVIISSITGMLETAYSWWAKDNDLVKRVDYEGLELIDQAKATGRGVLLIGSHFTTLDLAARMMTMKIDVDASYQQQNNPVFDHVILQSRLKLFRNMIEKTEMRRLVKLVKSGRTLWYASDQDFGRKHSVFAPFFGHPAATINTLSSILKLTKAKPLFFSHYRIGEGKNTRYLMRVSDPFAEQLGDDDLKNATLLNQVIEDAIRIAPEQYMWVHRRFKTRPNRHDPKFYDEIQK
jgi:KDO2-lipid IV(A) lauroyltransferase